MSAATPAATRSTDHLPWLIIAAGSIIAMLTFGPRSAMGFFQLPMLADTGWDRTTFGLAMAIQNLCWGLGQPFFGALADKFGTWRMLALSGLLYSSGLFIMAFASAPIWLHVGGGVLVGLGVASGSFGIVLSAFARNVAPHHRSFVFGIGTAAGSAGMFLFAPLSQGLISAYGWSDSLVYLGFLMLLVPLFAIPLRGNASSGRHAEALSKQTVGEALKEAFGHRSYLLLVSGFFVCGYQVAFITAHFPAYLGDIGIDARYAVIALALIGFFNIIGSLSAGFISQRYSKPYFLVWIYLGRSVAVAAFLLLPQSPTSVVIFSVVMGLLWLSTVPPTNALVAIMFGTRHLGLLGGVVFLSHQIGSFLGVWMGGYLYDRFGSYDPVWWLGVALGVFAAIVHWPIEERGVARPAMA
ncbi:MULTISPECIES: MFS transporter [Sinorhizobium]|uniref:MFS transporter n=1 Tax=Sinorhizobium americanum TaxID=194963 RepID=A0A2S3YH43_9HYPH|nr:MULTISPECIES: MFS transporter [Sinorhizobium]ASY55779.1 MFS permease [Sinorhizobium sp. CCBAU 05631]PDT40470.1 MFS transporter [Sinorhizobium sp. FG01]PDT52422.1 MFS transporter [Sinorhizobium sp. NG07B]POH25700.1 MFS transporter [Sinorhizobium americanum]POH28151.1 MFS transporter [Sinorhizobium americanum]